MPKPAIPHLNRRAACTGATRDSLRDCPGASVVPIAPAVRDAMRRAATAGCGGASRDVNMLKWTAMRLTEYAWREGARRADPSCPTISPTDLRTHLTPSPATGSTRFSTPTSTSTSCRAPRGYETPPADGRCLPTHCGRPPPQRTPPPRRAPRGRNSSRMAMPCHPSTAGSGWFAPRSPRTATGCTCLATAATTARTGGRAPDRHVACTSHRGMRMAVGWSLIREIRRRATTRTRVTTGASWAGPRTRQETNPSPSP